MQAVSKKYKQEMKKRYRDECSYIRVTIGLINQSAQANAKVKDAAAFTYFSALEKPFDNYQVQELYTTCDEDWSTVDLSLIHIW